MLLTVDISRLFSFYKINPIVPIIYILGRVDGVMLT